MYRMLVMMLVFAAAMLGSANAMAATDGDTADVEPVMEDDAAMEDDAMEDDGSMEGGTDGAMAEEDSMEEDDSMSEDDKADAAETVRLVAAIDDVETKAHIGIAMGALALILALFNTLKGRSKD